MSAPAKTAEKSTRGEQMRARLLAAASDVFAERGYDETRVSDINKAAGTSHGNFYWHFKNKDEILVEVLRPLLDRMHEQAQGRGTSANWISEDVYADNLVNQLLTYKKNRKLIRVMREAAIRGPKGTFFRPWMDVRRRFIERTENWLFALQRDGELLPGVDPVEAAEAELAMGEQLAYVRIGLPVKAPSNEDVSRMTRQAALIWYRGVIGLRDADGRLLNSKEDGK